LQQWIDIEFLKDFAYFEHGFQKLFDELH
jgi:hypothetical protein